MVVLLQEQQEWVVVARLPQPLLQPLQLLVWAPAAATYAAAATSLVEQQQQLVALAVAVVVLKQQTCCSWGM